MIRISKISGQHEGYICPESHNLQRMKTAKISVSLILLVATCCISNVIMAQTGTIPEGYTALFNGKDLSGWHRSRTNHHGTSGHFFAEDGAIVMQQYPYGQGGLLLTDQKYQDFELYFEFNGDAGTDGGLFFRSSESGSAYQLQIGGGGLRGTGNLFGELARVTKASEAQQLAQVWRKNEWNSFRLRVVGEKPHITLWINGVQVNELQADRNDLIADVTEGMIGLQLHWSQTVVPVPGGSCCEFSWKPGASHRYRNIAIKEL